MPYTTSARVRELVPQASTDNPDNDTIDDLITRVEGTEVNPYLKKIFSVPIESPDEIIITISSLFTAAWCLMVYVRGNQASAQAKAYRKIAQEKLDDIIRDPTMVTHTPQDSTKTSRDNSAVGISPAEGEGKSHFGLGDETTWGK